MRKRIIVIREELLLIRGTLLSGGDVVLQAKVDLLLLSPLLFLILSIKVQQVLSVPIIVISWHRVVVSQGVSTRRTPRRRGWKRMAAPPKRGTGRIRERNKLARAAASALPEENLIQMFER
jgi:hypothetical protein